MVALGTLVSALYWLAHESGVNPYSAEMWKELGLIFGLLSAFVLVGFFLWVIYRPRE